LPQQHDENRTVGGGLLNGPWKGFAGANAKLVHEDLVGTTQRQAECFVKSSRVGFAIVPPVTQKHRRIGITPAVTKQSRRSKGYRANRNPTIIGILE
jgi:hypothetical protein